MLSLKNIAAKINDKEILKDINLDVKPGEIHAIMGPNGSGKSTLSKLITGDESVELTSGSVKYLDEDLMEFEADERALKGIFLAFQYPVEIPGVNNAAFLRMAYNSKMKYEGKKGLDPFDFDELLHEKLEIAGMNEAYLDRAVNEGFSGGEKKRNEILQMAVLDPKLIILDEIDSGLDIDALKAVAEAVNKLKNGNNAFILITHYQRLLDYITPDYVHILSDGKFVKSGDSSLAVELEKNGYDGIISKA